MLAVRSGRSDAIKKRCGGGGGGGGEGFGGWEPSGGESSSGTSSGLDESIGNSSPEVLEPQTVTVTANRPAADPAQPVQVAAWDINLNGQ